MMQHKERAGGPGKKPLEKGSPVVRETGEAGEDSCRCKEVSKKSLPELLKVVISDLTFWKKAK
jgi:hypothetical protein